MIIVLGKTMGIVELSVFIILFLYISIKGEKKQKTITIIGMFILFLLAALRDETVGIDVENYLNFYKRHSLFNFSGLRSYLSVSDTRDPVYHYTGWLFSRIFKGTQWWLAAIAFIYSISVGTLIYKESKQTAISIVMLVSLGFFSFSLTGLRQTMAMSIILCTYPFLKQRKLIPFIITVVIASLYHISALVFLILYPISNMRLGIYHVLVALVAIVIFYAFKGWLLEILTQILGDERFEGYTSGEAAKLTMSGFFIQTVCLLFGLYYYKNLTHKDKSSLILYNASFLGWVFQIFSSFIAEFFRVSMFFSIFNIILIANASCCEKDRKSRNILQIVVIVVFVLYMLKDGAAYYKFFWQ